MFSIFGKGYKNKKGEIVLSANPQKEINVQQAYSYIISDAAKSPTSLLRELSDDELQRDFKKLNFMTATFSGTFEYRKADRMKQYSGLMAVDIDDLESTEEVFRIKQLLISDSNFETELLFTSPRGLGLKWIIYVGDRNGCTHKAYFDFVKDYLQFQYGIIVDRSGSDVCRACFLPHDRECYINKSLLENTNCSIYIEPAKTECKACE